MGSGPAWHVIRRLRSCCCCRLGCITRIQLLSWVVHILTEVMLGRSHGQGLSACLGHHHSWHPAACYADLLCPAAALS